MRMLKMTILSTKDRQTIKRASNTLSKVKRVRQWNVDFGVFWRLSFTSYFLNYQVIVYVKYLFNFENTNQARNEAEVTKKHFFGCTEPGYSCDPQQSTAVSYNARQGDCFDESVWITLYAWCP